MSYTLVPTLVDIPKLRSLMGSKDAVLLQAVIKKHRKDMLSTDEMGDDFEDFEKEIKAEYKAFAAGDFSGVDLQATYPESPLEDDMDEEEMAELREDLKNVDTKDPAAIMKLFEKHAGALGDLFEDEDDEEDDDDEAEEEDEEVVGRQITTGAALVHLIMGGNVDRSQGFKYGYALLSLCEYLGEKPFHDSWCSIRSASIDAVDAVLAKLGANPKAFTASKMLVSRGAPVDIPKPSDFPFIGYLERNEIPPLLAMLDESKVEAAIAGEDPHEQEWFRNAIGELRTWLSTCVKTDRDLVCFYC